MTISWTNNMLTLSSPTLPGGKVDVWYLEAFCRPGGHDREWSQTTIPHKTTLVKSDPHKLLLRTVVEPALEIWHEIRVSGQDVDFHLSLTNKGTQPLEAQWFQPCMRVDRFTNRKQTNYHERSFIFTEKGLTFLHEMPRAEEARYRGGQVYVPRGIKEVDVNPRPISPVRPVNDLIGCISDDGNYLLAMAWERTHELFQGVIVCLHNDPNIEGLGPGESRKLRGKIYFMKNDSKALLEKYRRDFPAAARK